MLSASDMTVVARNELPDVSALPFDASFPSSAEKPLVVFVYDPVQHLAGVDAEYDSKSPYGAFRLREERNRVGVIGDLVQSVSGFCNDGGDGAGSGCTSALVDVGSGLRGAILYGPNGDTSVTAVDTVDGQDYTLIVMGPPCDARCRCPLPSPRLTGVFRGLRATSREGRPFPPLACARWASVRRALQEWVERLVLVRAGGCGEHRATMGYANVGDLRASEIEGWLANPAMTVPLLDQALIAGWAASGACHPYLVAAGSDCGERRSGAAVGEPHD